MSAVLLFNKDSLQVETVLVCVFLCVLVCVYVVVDM